MQIVKNQNAKRADPAGTPIDRCLKKKESERKKEKIQNAVQKVKIQKFAEIPLTLYQRFYSDSN